MTIEVSGNLIYHNGRVVALVILPEGTALERFVEELDDSENLLPDARFDRIKRDLDYLIRMQKEQLSLLTGDD